MSELSFNYKGQRFAPPSRAVFWSVRRMRDGQRGQLDVVRDAHGLPLIVPIAIGIAGFREAVGDQYGRYRLDALDADKMQLDGAEPAYVSVPQPRKVIEIEAGETVIDPDLEHDQAVARDVIPVPGLRNAAPMPTTMVTPMVTSPIGTWPALPMPVAMTGEQYLVGEALRGLVQLNKHQGDSHNQQLGQLTAMVSATLGSMQPLLVATTTRAERVETLLAELLLRQQGITPPSPPPPVTPPPPAPSQPTPPSASTVVYAMPRNAAFVDEGYDDGEDDDDDDLDDAPIEAQGGEDMIDKINKLVEKVALALAPVANVAQMVMGAGLGRGLFGGGDDSPRNAAGDSPAAEPEVDSEPEPSLGHLRTSHVLAVSHELGVQDGSIFRTMIRAMEQADRQMFVDRLCAMPLDEAVPFAAEKVDWLKARIARSRARCADATTETTHTTDDDAPAGADLDQEHDTTQHDADPDLDSTPPTDDTTPDPEHDTDQHDTDLDEPTHLDDQEHERDPHLENLADTIVPSGDEARDDAAVATDATATTPSDDHRSPMSTALATTATAPEAPRPVTPDVTAHMKRIAKHLKFTEILQAQQLINNTSVPERNAWIERLMALDPSEAATVVRAELARRAGR